MPTMMQHPIHGRHSAHAGEVERMLSNGWTVMPPKRKATEAEQSAPEVDPATDETEAEQSAPARRTRKAV